MEIPEKDKTLLLRFGRFFSPLALLGALASQGPPEQVEPKADSHATLAPGNWSTSSPELLVSQRLVVEGAGEQGRQSW
ncbi:hypothetical protein F2Q70_00020459 [Brassica cretica]|uniref:Uncharacterized protein n=1 Tax=Brassica cretica TaxID=69181 RepID=A0A8S9GR68_BRACR|nr:hypothetical protein F2Q70_00020459 [Brassica cretica]KAF3584503.1 hypothetical protein F2Q69_00027424 [Brassica cretica]